MTAHARRRLAWGIRHPSGVLVSDWREAIGEVPAPAGCVATWPTLIFAARRFARDYLAWRFGPPGSAPKRPRVVRVVASVEVWQR